MGVGKSFQMALSSIVNSKMRSFLTMLGIIIGIAAVIILVSLMGGLTGQLTSMFDDLGANTIQVSITTRSNTKKVEPDEMYQLIDDNPDLLKNMSPLITVSGSIKRETINNSGNAQGVSEGYIDITSLKVGQGRFIQYADVKAVKKVCVIGAYQVEEYFGEEEALGQQLKINGTPFTVVGVMEKKEDATSGSKDDALYIPYSTAMKMSKNSFVNTYAVTAADSEKIDETVAVIKQLLNKKIGDEDYYNVVSLKEILDQMSTMMDSMQTVLVCIAGISLLVGGIGIMNIMLVSVTERTREIGIRKSLGAKQKDIMMQFVIEAGTVSCIGGVFGIILGSLVSVLAGNLLNLEVVPSVTSIIVAFTVSVAIGVGFGYLPAKKAAQLNPIDALRYD